ncbi:Gp37-like protein [Auritidibacter ignavus]|uniref:Gp37-like protein n=1 Tax=Auritidibacter ignavus TaxID=678932 RepID=UPI0024BB09DB|nr:hypothetical protein [Auritidibacter ignavus]WHS27531.1 hypothetical protein QM395_09130 [Auritidibacter ignavus]
MIHADFYNRDLQRLGRIPILGGSAVIRNNAVSTGVLDVNGNSPLWRRFETDPRYRLEGGHVAVYDGKDQLIAGKLKQYVEPNTSGLKDIELHFECHLSYVHGMITLPSPNRAPESQTVRPYYRETGPAETVIKDAVRLHVSQNAPRAENRNPIIVDLPEGRGKRVTINSRFQNLLEELQAVSKNSGVVFFSYLDHETSQIRFGVRKPNDYRRSIRLREANGSVEQYSYSLEAPTASRVLVAGQGEGTGRMLRLVESDQTDWEVKTLLFQDRRDTEEAKELIKAGEDTLADHVEKQSITIDTSMMGNLKYGRDFTRGDLITVQLTDKTNIQDTLQRVELNWDKGGTTYKVSVGPVMEEPDANDGKVRELIKELRAELRRTQNN